jgi:uncharacterized protein (TIGR03437 family)
MYLPKIQSIFSLSALCIFGLTCAFGQTQDNSQNALLKGSYHFRHLAVQNVDANYNPTDITATYGTIVFDGAGNYTLTGTTVDNVATNGVSQPLSVTGTYAIGSNGTGYITNPLYETDPNAYIYGAVSQGVYTGSSTEAENDGNYLNDIFVAIPAAATAPTNASFTASYQTGLLDFTGAGSTATKNALFELSPNGKGAFGTITLNGQAANINSATVAQTITAATYNFNSDGSATLTIPAPSGQSANTPLFTGTKTIFESADGNFIIGWTSGGYDIFFGVKALAVTGTNSLSTGLYFTAALEDSPDILGTDSFYGGTNNSGDAAGDGIVHERLSLVGLQSEDFGSDDKINLNSDGTTACIPGYPTPCTDLNGYAYIFGDAGQAFVAIGTNGYYSLIVGMHAPSFSGPGVYLNPIGVVNAANFMPVTASIAPGELLELFGTGLAPAGTSIQIQGGQPFPTTGVGGVTVTIDGINCPIYSVTPTSLSVGVPYAVALNQTGLANVQVSNNGVLSNVVQVYLTDAVPGSFSQGADGIGYAAATHLNGQLITPSNPVQPSENIVLYLTGLGTVTPTIADGAVASATTLSWADLYNSGNLTVNFNDYTNGTAGNAGTIGFAGLVPTLAGLYQINVQVPSTGLVAGDNVYLEFITDAADVNEVQIPYGAGAVTPDDVSAKAAARHKAEAARIRALRAARAKMKKATPRKLRTNPDSAIVAN